MAKQPNQKLKLLYLMRILTEKTDENHTMTVAEMISELAANGISAERKSVYDDLEALRLFGLDIIQIRGKSTVYYVGSRSFELPELKLLVDSVQSSKFITEKKTLSLIRKIEGLASSYDAQLLQRQVYVRGRVKTMNESVYYNIDEIAGAINKNLKIRYQYFEYALNKERRFRKGGEFYLASPFALIWDDENYYMLAYHEGRMKHFRVDKMAAISAADEEREGGAVFDGIDMSEYSKKVFGMFAGSEQRVRLRFANHLIGVVIDRFGKEVMPAPDGPEHFTVTVDAVVSPLFYGWLFSFGDEVEILAPEEVRAGMRSTLDKTRSLY